MFNLFKKTKTPPTQLAPQLTTYQRDALRQPGALFGALTPSIYEEMQRDAMIQTALNVKRLAAISADWRLIPASDSAESHRHVDFIAESFAKMEGSPLTILQQAMDAFAKGWSVQEIVFERQSEGLGIAAVRAKDPSLFGLDVDTFGRLKRLSLRTPGEADRPLPIHRFVVYRSRSTYAHPKGRSDLDAAYPHWKSKQKLLNAWQFHLERFAMPTVLGAFQAGVTNEERDSILGALQNLQGLTAIVHPQEIDIKTLGGDKEPSTGFQEAIEFHNREMARSILGQTLTTDEGRRVGSLALGKVHLQVLILQMNALRSELADHIMTEQVIRPLMKLNFGDAPSPRFEFEEVVLDVFRTGRVQ